ncbi:MAG: hypothetical protein LBU75_03355 [Desulfovibrio sp.]|nr:hypothetical protein [Desulfovibrio sp.]
MVSFLEPAIFSRVFSRPSRLWPFYRPSTDNNTSLFFVEISLFKTIFHGGRARCAALRETHPRRRHGIPRGHFFFLNDDKRLPGHRTVKAPAGIPLANDRFRQTSDNARHNTVLGVFV